MTLKQDAEGPENAAGSPRRSASSPARGRAVGYRIRGSQGRLIQALGEMIVSGEIAPGQLLPREAEIMDRFEVSRTTVREAVKVLEAKGLVETRQRVGTRTLSRDHWNIFDADILALHVARGVDEDLLQDLVEMRQLVEPPAARFAALRATAADKDRIAVAYERMQAGQKHPDAYSEADVAFHLAVFAASHNALLRRFSHLVADFLRISFEIQQRALNDADNRIEDDVDGHRLVYEAIRQGDPAGAEAAMCIVLMNGRESLMRALDGSRA